MNKNLLVIVGIFACIFTPSISSAKLGDHNVVLIHGFKITDLVTRPNREEILARRHFSPYWHERADGFLNWASHHRLKGGIARAIFAQAKTLSANGTCTQGNSCVLVTHSTGDLVARYFIAHQEAWLKNAGYEPLNIVASIDLAGAGGGTDLADLAVGFVGGSSTSLEWISGIRKVWDIDLSELTLSQLGVARDLTTSRARSHASWPEDVPRLRFSVSGHSPGLGIVHTIIRGADDTVIPAHSTCGASAPWFYESCSRNVAYDGKREWEFGPGGLMPNHYPVLMSDAYDHENMKFDTHKGKVTYVLNNFNRGLDVNFSTHTHTVTRRWWEIWKGTGTWQYVNDSDRKHISAIIYDTFNN